MRAFADQIRPFVPGRYTVLGTDGFGRSDYRVKLREFFEVDRYHVAVAALKALADNGIVEATVVQDAIERYGIDPDARPALEALSPALAVRAGAPPRRPPMNVSESVTTHPHRPHECGHRRRPVRNGHWARRARRGTSVGLPQPKEDS